jgi:hypothetical protein
MPYFMRQMGGVLVLCCIHGAAQSAIYSCVDDHGRRLTSDKPITECLHREQRLLNTDGSLNKIVGPSLSVQEQAELEVKERQEAQERAFLRDAMRRDRNLLLRYPNEGVHQKARNAAVDNIIEGIRFSDARLLDLKKERKPLLQDAEFYVGKALPFKLKRLLDANQAAANAQQTFVQNQKAELARIEALYDSELARLRKMWAGALPGFLDAPASSPKSSLSQKNN